MREKTTIWISIFTQRSQIPNWKTNNFKIRRLEISVESSKHSCFGMGIINKNPKRSQKMLQLKKRQTHLMLFELKSIKDVDKPRQNNRKKPLLLCNSGGPFKWYHNDVHFVYAMNRFANIVSCGRVSNSALKI